MVGHGTPFSVYINWHTRVKACINCGELKSFQKFSPIGRKTVSGRIIRYSVCKECRSEINCVKNQAKRVKIRPWEYLECPDEDCGKIWWKRKGKICPCCGREGVKIEA